LRRRMIDDGMRDGLWMSKKKAAIRRASRQYSTISVCVMRGMEEKRREEGEGGSD